MGNTPASDKKVPSGADAIPQGTKMRSMPDKESPNCGTTMPLKEQNFLKDAAGKA